MIKEKYEFVRGVLFQGRREWGEDETHKKSTF